MADYIKKIGMTLLKSDKKKKIGETLLEPVIESGMKELTKYLTDLIKQPPGEVSEEQKTRDEKYNRISKQNQLQGVKLTDLQNNYIESCIITKHLLSEKDSVGMMEYIFTKKDSVLYKEVKKWANLLNDIHYTEHTLISYEITNIYYRKIESGFFDGYPDIVNEALSLETKSQLDELIVRIIEEQG